MQPQLSYRGKLRLPPAAVSVIHTLLQKRSVPHRCDLFCKSTKAWGVGMAQSHRQFSINTSNIEAKRDGHDRALGAEREARPGGGGNRSTTIERSLLLSRSGDLSRLLEGEGRFLSAHEASSLSPRRGRAKKKRLCFSIADIVVRSVSFNPN